MDKETIHIIWNAGLSLLGAWFLKMHSDNRKREEDRKEKKQRLDEKTDERLRNLELNAWKKEDHDQFEQKMLISFSEIKDSLKENAMVFNTAIKELGHELNSSVKDLSVSIAQIESKRRTK